MPPFLPSDGHGFADMALTFEWDERKAGSNLAQHGASFEEAATVFSDSLSLDIDDTYEEGG